MRTKIATVAAGPSGSWLLGLTLAYLVCGAPLPTFAETVEAIRGPDLFFEGNLGQFPDGVSYVARGPGYHVVFDERGATYDLGALDGAQQIRIVPVEGRAPTEVLASGPLPGKINYFRGNDPEPWVVGAPTWDRVTLRGVYDGIDMVYRRTGREPSTTSSWRRAPTPHRSS